MVNRFATLVVVALIAAGCGGSQTSLKSSGSAPLSMLVRPDPAATAHSILDAQHASERVTFTESSSQPLPLMPMALVSRGATAPRAVSTQQKREVFGFAPYWLLNRNAEWDYSVLSTVAYFGLDVNSNGTFVPSGNGWNGWNSAELTNIINNAHRAASRVVVVIKNFNAGSINTLDTNSFYRQTLIDNVIAAIQSKNLDGVNIDFEAATTTDFPDLQIGMTTLMRELSPQVHARWPQAEVSIDTYAGSASWDLGLFKIGDLAPVVDAFFIMNYDSVFDNMPGQAGPNSPMNGWTYNDTLDVDQYLSKAPASKIILGVPYYGYRWSTVNGGPRSAIVGTKPIAEGYSAAMDDLACPHPALTRGWDSLGQSPWASWWSPPTNDPCGDNLGYPQEMYYDDATSLGFKYDLVNQRNLRGAGMWTLGMDTGRTELWSTLKTYFSCPVSVSAPAAPTTTEFSLSLSAGTCSVGYYDVQQLDTTTSQGWFTLAQVTPSGSASVAVQGYPGHTYQFQARAHTTAGLVSSWNMATSAVAPGATYSHLFKGLYTVDAYGGISADDSPPLATSAYWPGWKIARTAKPLPGANSPQSGLVMDAWGGLHPYGAPAITESSPGHYWPGWEIARDFAFLPDGTGGFVLDGWGGLHPFRVNGSTTPLQAQGNPYWGGWDIARKVVIFPDGTGGYTMDAWGGLHPFGINGPAPVSAVAQSGAYWPGWNIARDVVLVPGNGNHSGYILDGWGGLHPFHAANDSSTMPAAIAVSAYWGGWDIARGVFFLPGSATAGYTLDGYGGPHPFGGAPAITSYPYWGGSDIARAIIGG